MRQAAITSCSVRTAPVVEDDEGADRLSEHLVRDADDRRLLDALDVEDGVLHLDRADLLAARLDDVVTAPDEVEEALLVDGEVVLGAEHPLAGERPVHDHLGGLLGLPPVARP